MRGVGIRTGDAFGIILPKFAVFQLQLHVMPGPIVNRTKGFGKENKTLFISKNIGKRIIGDDVDV